jgi:hypothetical protein
VVEVGDDNNSGSDVSRLSICSSGGSNEIVHMYKSPTLSPPNVLTLLFRVGRSGLGAGWWMIVRRNATVVYPRNHEGDGRPPNSFFVLLRN